MRPGSCSRVVVIILLTVLAVLLGGFPKSMTVMGATSRSEIKRRLELPPFAYVAETDHDYSNIEQGQIDRKGALAYIDSGKDALVNRPESGSSLQEVAVSPDGTKVYVTDAYEPVLRVFDAETGQYIMDIELPGVEARDPDKFYRLMQTDLYQDEMPYSTFFEICSSAVGCTPDGTMILVCSSAGLQVIDAQTNEVIKTLESLIGGMLAISFDGTRAYISQNNFRELPPRSYYEWFEMVMTSEDYRLIALDLNTWQILEEIQTAAIGGIAVRPDLPEVLFSEVYTKQVRAVDANTLENLWQVSAEPSYPGGLGFLPDGSKVYAVCNADTGFLDVVTGKEMSPKIKTAEDYYCAVIDTAEKKLVKKIPLEAF